MDVYFCIVVWKEKTLGAVPGAYPTYVYPETLKRVVRELLPGDVVDKPDPSHDNVSLIYQSQNISCLFFREDTSSTFYSL